MVAVGIHEREQVGAVGHAATPGYPVVGEFQRLARRDPVRYWVAVGSILLVAVLYVTPAVEALRLGSYATDTPLALPNIALPRVAFPKLNVPRAHAVPATPPAAPA